MIPDIEKLIDEFMFNAIDYERDHSDTYYAPQHKEARSASRTALVAAIEALVAEKERAVDLLALILPLAKGYAAEHPVGSNQKYVEAVEAALKEAK